MSSSAGCSEGEGPKISVKIFEFFAGYVILCVTTHFRLVSPWRLVRDDGKGGTAWKKGHPVDIAPIKYVLIYCRLIYSLTGGAKLKLTYFFLSKGKADGMKKKRFLLGSSEFVRTE